MTFSGDEGRREILRENNKKVIEKVRETLFYVYVMIHK